MASIIRLHSEESDQSVVQLRSPSHIVYCVHILCSLGQYGARIVTYLSVVKLQFTLRASARAVAPESLIPFPSRLWKRVLQN